MGKNPGIFLLEDGTMKKKMAAALFCAGMLAFAPLTGAGITTPRWGIGADGKRGG